ncbi:hypothetical protein HDV05_000620 [Chytridiales sp. JEL 0842]|nr:hypothetical protein HDV05_000620 [Chytridiales sp. JEL 0842]
MTSPTSSSSATPDLPNTPQRQKSFTFSKSIDSGLAGFIAGAVSTAVLHPLDLVKTRFQVDDSTRRGAYGVRGTLDAWKGIVRLDGYKGLYRGLSANLAGATLSWGLYFWWYSMIQDQMRSFRGMDITVSEQKQRLPPGDHMLASALAGALTSLITNPFWLVKTRMCADRASDPNAYKSLTEGLWKTYKGEGVRGLYKGIVPALFGVSHGALQFMAYEEMKKWRAGEGSTEKLGTGEYILFAAGSKVFATVVTYPYQVVRSRIQIERARKNVKYQGTIGTIKRIYNIEGFYGFYKGLGPNVIRVLPGTMITFGVYEGLSKFFREYAS